MGWASIYMALYSMYLEFMINCIAVWQIHKTLGQAYKRWSKADLLRSAFFWHLKCSIFKQAMINAQSISNLLFLDIETVPERQDFSELTQLEQELWADKTRYKRRDQENPSEYHNMI